MVNKAIFLSRDGTIVDNPDYLSDPNQVKLLNGAARAINDMRAMGYKLIVATNQPAVAQGVTSEETLAKIHEKLVLLLANEGAYLDKIYYCPFHPDGAIPKYRKDDYTRKPNPGMLLAAADDFDINAKDSWMIGDSDKDIEAGARAGCKTILITHSKPTPLLPPGQQGPDFKAVNITEAANIIKKHHRTKPPELQPVHANSIEPGDENDVAAKPIEVMRKTEAQLDAAAITENPQKGSSTLETPNTEHKNDSPQPESKPEHDEKETSAPLFNEMLEPQAEKSSQPDEQPEGQVQPRNTEESIGEYKTQYLLEKVLEQLKSKERSEMFDDFRVTRFIAGILQVGVFLCLVISIWLLMSPERQSDLVLIALGFAAVLQLMALTFYMMRDN